MTSTRFARDGGCAGTNPVKLSSPIVDRPFTVAVDVAAASGEPTAIRRVGFESCAATHLLPGGERYRWAQTANPP